LPEDGSHKAIVFASRLCLKVPKASLLEEEDHTATLDVIGETRISIPSASDVPINARH
jgi:hypothetical protein